MTIKNTKEKYGSIAIILHWLIALLVIAQLTLGLFMVEFRHGIYKNDLVWWHKEIGVSILLLMTIRLAWRLGNRIPLPPPNTPYWQDLAARSVHFLLYVILFALPLTGWMMSSAGGYSVSVFGLFNLPHIISPNEHLAFIFRITHKTLALTLIGLLVLHIGAVFLYYIFYKYNLLKRILP